VEQIQGMIEQYGVAKVIVGMPYDSQGDKGTRAQEVETFIAHLGNVITVEVDTWDESLTTVEAGRIHRATGMKRKKRREKGRLDEMAARVLLQEYLDTQTPRK
jgi:putative Holliday junction resolvase